MSKIKSITVVTAQGVNQHKVGDVENGMKIYEIRDNTKLFKNSIDFIFEGLTDDHRSIFTLINAPVEICYFKEG